MTPALSVLLLWLGFAGSHLLLSSMSVRQRLIGRLGELPFRGLYSLVALAFFVPLVRIYFRSKHSGPWLWAIAIGPVLTVLIYVGMGIAFTLLLSGLIRPSPASVVAGAAKASGAFRITRHPVLMGFALFGLLHMIPNGSATDVAFFGGFVLFTLVGTWHQDQRKLASGTPGFREFYAATPFLPFTGGHVLQAIREMGPLLIGAGVVVTVVVRYFHSSWFGG
jgi:uncharacterized membrane protein